MQLILVCPDKHDSVRLGSRYPCLPMRLTRHVNFLNKLDIFKEKLLYSPVRRYFPDYTGKDEDYNAAREYFKQRFLRLNRSPSKEIYCKRDPLCSLS